MGTERKGVLMEPRFGCREISPGTAEGEVLLSEDRLLFYHAEPATGVITERGHCLEGISVKDKILVFPGGKGSSVVQMDGLYKLDKWGAAPLAFLVEEPDTVLVSSAIIMGVPMADRIEAEFYRAVKTGDRIRLDTARRTITLVERRS